MRGSRTASGAGGAFDSTPWAVAQPDRSGCRRQEHDPGEGVEGGVEPGGRCDRRQREGCRGRSDRNGSLAQPEREPTLVAREPGEDRPPARGDATRPERPGEGHPDKKRCVAAAGSRCGDEAAARRQAGADHPPLADPIGQDTPGEQRHDRAYCEGGEDRGDLDERECERVLDGWAERRKPALDGPAGGRSRPLRLPAPPSDSGMELRRRSLVRVYAAAGTVWECSST